MTATKKQIPFLLIAILFFSFITRVWNLHLPKSYVFDEVYHAVTAKLIAKDDSRAYEWWNPPPEPNTAVDWLHPPLAKYTQALGMIAFGENPFGRRISSAVFGVLVILLTYLLAKNLFDDENLALLAAFLASLDGLLLVQSRVAMNDIHVTFFILLTLVLYVKHRQKHPHSWKWLLASGAGAGLAISSKWSGMFVLGTLWFFEGVRFVSDILATQWQKQNQTLGKFVLQFFGQRFLFLLCLPVVIYLLSYSQMFFQGKSLICHQQEVVPNTCYLKVTQTADGERQEKYISHFQELHHQIWWYQTNLEATHSYQSRPWQWWLNLRPVWYAVDYPSTNQISNIYAFGNPLLFWTGDIAFLLLSIISLTIWIPLAIKWLKTKKKKGIIYSPTIILLFSYLVVWLPWMLSPRIMFFYHYTPAVPLLAIILAYQLVQLWQLKPASSHLIELKWNHWLVILVVSSITLSFFVWYPHWTGIPVSKEWADLIYFVVPSWK